jgi:hypothetical protein
MLSFLVLWLLRQVWVNELGLKYKVLPEMGQKTGAFSLFCRIASLCVSFPSGLYGVPSACFHPVHICIMAERIRISPFLPPC